MPVITNGRHLFNEVPCLLPFQWIYLLIKSKVPKGYPVPGKATIYDASQTIDLNAVPLNGGFLLKTLALSIDPFMRGKSELGHNFLIAYF